MPVLAGSADVILIPEIPFSFESMLDKIRQREKSGSRFTNIVVAEGASEVGTQPKFIKCGTRKRSAARRRRRLICASESKQITGKESRCVVLGHLAARRQPERF